MAQTKAQLIDGKGDAVINNKLLVGTPTARNKFFNTSQDSLFQVEGVSGGSQVISHTYGEAGNGGPYLVFTKNRSGTIGGTTVVNDGDQIGAVSFQGSDGSEAVEAARIQAFVDGAPGANDMPGRLVFSTTADGASSPTERARITNDGYFKASNNATYNTASPDYHQFNQNGNSQWTLGVFNRHGSDPYGLRVTYTATSPNNTVSHFLYCDTTGGLFAAIRSNGGFANVQANDANLSDIRTKKDITPAADTWNCIKEWEIVNYRYKNQPDDAALNLGVIAQQVAKSCPEVITVFQERKETTETEPAQEERLGVREQQMYWMAIKALQEAQVRIEALEAEVAALKAQ